MCGERVLQKDGIYHLAGEGQHFDAEGFAQYLATLCERYPIVSIEDGMDESDWAGWAALTRRLGARVQLVGDDLFVTNTEILALGIEEQVANAILIKFNQIGTLSETLDAIAMASKAGYASVISTALARRKTSPSPIWPWAREPGRSKPGPFAALIGWRSTTSCSGSKKP